MLFISSPSYAAKLKLGETYFGTLNKLYLGNNTIALPPGQWEVVELETEKGYTDFKKAKFKNKKKYIYKLEVYFWKLLKKKSMIFIRGGYKQCL